MGEVLFGYRHVTGVPKCPCNNPGNYMMCEQGPGLLHFLMRCWCGSTLKGTFDDEAERTAFLESNQINER